jgi:hypothetical protein
VVWALLRIQVTIWGVRLDLDLPGPAHTLAAQRGHRFGPTMRRIVRTPSTMVRWSMGSARN